MLFMWQQWSHVCTGIVIYSISNRIPYPSHLVALIASIHNNTASYLDMAKKPHGQGEMDRQDKVVAQR
jgi:hypothetical protein